MKDQHVMISVRRLPYALLYLFVAGLFIFAQPHLIAQVASWPLDGPAFSASPAEISASAAKISPEKFADATVLYEEEKYQIDASGRVTNTHRVIYRIETAEGVDAWSEASVEWEPFYQKEPSIRARVIQANGSVAELDQKTVTDVPAQDEDEGTYSDNRIHKAPLPALSAGAIVEQETTRVDKETFFAGGEFYQAFFQRDVPVVRTRLVVEVPSGIPLQYKTGFLPQIANKDEETGGIRRLTFDQGHLAPWVESDINLATPFPRAPWVEFSTGKSWQSVSHGYFELAEPQIKPDQVKSILPAVSPQDRLVLIQSIVASLHKEVRYTGVEFGESGLKPQTPGEVLKRHYGDCKDKASLLVAMLRASGIPANLALLNSGPGRDVTPELPGMNQFDHAIVYVAPASAGDRALWIDATADFNQVGSLPYEDQGRLALIIAEETKDLTLTPEARPEDSVLVEVREFRLANYGPAHVLESSQTTGHIDANYRSYYGGTETKDLRTSLESYVKEAYSAKALTKVEYGDGKDFSKPFSLRLEVAQASRGTTGIKDAAVAVYPSITLDTLPKWFSTDPTKGHEKPSAEDQANQQDAERQRSTEYDVQPFISECHYRITPPDGFVLRALPADKTLQMGPATLTETYSTDQPGIVTAVLRFDIGKPRYTAEEALALRKAVLDVSKEDAVMITFDQTGAKLLAAGKVREALAADRSVIASHPGDVLNHVRMAYALLDAGIGDQARVEAVKATTLDPKSAIAYSTLAWVLQFNSIGVRFGKGFDLKGGIEAYRKAKQLDPEDSDIRVNLAILYEYDANGTRYASIPGLNSAIKEYQELKQQDKATGERYEDNLLFAMLYARQFKELLAELASQPSTPTRDSLGITAVVATEGVAAGIQRADHISGDATQRNTALRNAGTQLMRLRLYPETAEILSAGIQGQSDAADIARQIEVFRNLKPFDPHSIPDTGPTAVVQRMMADFMTGKLTDEEITSSLSRHAYATEAEWQKNIHKNDQLAGMIDSIAERMGMAPSVLEDATLGNMKLTAKGDDETGYRVTLQFMGAAPEQFFVTKEDSHYRIVASQDDSSEVGTEAIYLLHHGDEKQARSLLDWKRDQLHKGGGDDPLTGPLLPRFWTSGESKGTDAIELASASLLVGSSSIGQLLPAITARRDKASDTEKPDQTDLNLMLAYGYARVGDGANLQTAAQVLVKTYPDSTTALHLAGEAYRLNRDWASWNAMLDQRLAKHPTDRNLLVMKAGAQQAQGDWAGARKTLRGVLDGGEATTNDYNSYAWNSLFEGKADEDAIQAAQQANMLTKNGIFPELHTLSCLYAAQGKTTEARQVLLQAMGVDNLAEPNSEVWYAFGAIYQQYGERDAAVAALKKVEKPDGPMGPTDTYVLAEAHLKALNAM
jgi:tetratricopeptide (TPR) repeat protein